MTAINELWRRWAAAGSALVRDPRAQVPCPRCGQASLLVEDVPAPDPTHQERRLRCPACKATSAIRMRRP